MQELKIVYLERIHGAWQVRFSGDTETFQYLLTCFRERRRLHLDTKMQWIPENATEKGYWILSLATLKLYQSKFSNYAEEVQKAEALWKAGAATRQAEREFMRRMAEEWARSAYFYAPSSALQRALQVLQLPTLPEKQDITKQYRTLAKIYHPDLGGDHMMMARINEAYSIVMQYAERSRV